MFHIYSHNMSQSLYISYPLLFDVNTRCFVSHYIPSGFACIPMYSSRHVGVIFAPPVPPSRLHDAAGYPAGRRAFEGADGVPTGWRGDQEPSLGNWEWWVTDFDVSYDQINAYTHLYMCLLDLRWSKGLACLWLQVSRRKGALVVEGSHAEKARCNFGSTMLMKWL